MQRRQFLATTGALLAPAFAGCGHPPVVLDMNAVDDTELAHRRSTEGAPDEQALIAAAVAGERPTTTGTSPPLDADRPVREDDAYYEFSYEVVDERTETGYDVRLDYDPVKNPTRAVDYADLPTHDREVLSGLFPPDEDAPDNDGTDIGVFVRYSNEQRDASVLVPTPKYDAVVYEGEAYPVEVGESRELTVETYRYTATEVAASSEAYAAQLRERYLFTLSGLSDAEREVVEQAIDGGYFEDSAAFQSVADRFDAHEPLSGERGSYGDWLAQYEGETYLTYLEY
ncbi:hypothetical protein SAMN04487949_0225 [Halogranum gelatinilyticum]|uniref:Uncharacterized protein n=1 Tax=Halogranum gelatinilyticum TaxID=660521 RepID=A0A1G9P574_9EURY|nr:hypothetical protein [Halogranum gelatinilyticum]SDL93377.1 hypothetical protein SAMN04487949_0225 [Halogranum gelatinilyticum]